MTTISTPVFSANLIPSPLDDRESVTATPNQGGATNQTSGLGILYLRNVNAYIERDTEYAYLLHGVPGSELKRLQDESKSQLSLLSHCIMEATKDYQVYDRSNIRAALGQLIVIGASSLRSVLNSEEKNIADKFTNFFSRLGCSNEEDNLPVTDQAYKLPYLTLAIAHTMKLAGYAPEGSRLLALWIDESTASAASDGVPDWYRIRALIHLSDLLVGDGTNRARHDTAQRTIELLDDALPKTSGTPDLARFEKWVENCQHSMRRSVDNINFALMMQRNQLIEEALLVDRRWITANHLSYTERNVEVPQVCYSRLLGRGDLSNAYRGVFLANRGRVLSVLADRGHLIAPEGRRDLESYRKARAYFLRALALLRPIAEAERKDTVVEFLEPRPFSEEVQDIEGYLRAIEKVLNIR